MMHQPLLIKNILMHARRTFPATEIVSRTDEKSTKTHSIEEIGRRAAQLSHTLIALKIKTGGIISLIFQPTICHVIKVSDILRRYIGQICKIRKIRLAKIRLAKIRLASKWLQVMGFYRVHFSRFYSILIYFKVSQIKKFRRLF